LSGCWKVCGEALNQLYRIAPAVAETIPHARDIIGFRNILAHGYATAGTQLAFADSAYNSSRVATAIGIEIGRTFADQTSFVVHPRRCVIEQLSLKQSKPPPCQELRATIRSSTAFLYATGIRSRQTTCVPTQALAAGAAGCWSRAYSVNPCSLSGCCSAMCWIVWDI